MLTQKVIIEKIKELKPELEEKYNVTRLGLFGSYANGSPEENSDIDILIDFKKPVGWDYFKIEKLLEDCFNKKIDIVTPSALKMPLKSEILGSVIEL
jgi:uncharacterized protein